MKRVLQFIRERRWNAWLKPHRIPGLVRELDALRKENKALRRWVHARHVPLVRSVPSDPLKALLGIGKRFALVGILTVCGDASAQPILRTFFTTNTTPVVTASIAARDTTTSNGLVTFTLTASNNVRLVAGLDATNHANGILQSATNYANGVTNSSIVRQADLTAASNDLVNFTLTASNNVRLVAGLDATNHANAILQSATNYANGVTNSSIVRQVELTAASNALVSFTLTASNSVRIVAGLDATNHANAILQSATNYANGVTNSSIVRQAELTAASNTLNSAIISATNSASVTNWINSRQPASANLTNWSLIPTGAMANVVSTDFLTNWANAISNLTQTKTALTTNANQFGASVQLTIKDGVLLTNATLHATTDHVGAVTNESRMNTAGGVTNWIQTESKGTLYASSNALVKAGQSVSNAWVGGTIVWDLNNYTNLNGVVTTFSNLANCVIPAHTLTNNGDMIRAFWGGVSATAMQNTQNFRIVYGSTTLLDTGLQIGSNYLYRAKIEITRTGNTSQHVDAQLEWLPNLLGLTGLPFTSTNVMRETLVETNGINTTLALQVSARRVGALTNTQFRAYYDPAVR